MKVHKSTQKAKEKHEGRIYPSNRFGDVEILEYINSKKAVIKFINTGYISEEDWASIKSGHIRDRSLPTTCGFGYIDIENASIGRNATKEYGLWNNMINRCYNENLRYKHSAYVDCTVSEKWRYLSNFKDWCNKQIGFSNDGWHLDKDILVKGNKTYSENTCCFVPQEINTLILKADRIRGKYPIGVYHDTSKIHKRFSARVSKGGKYKRFGSYLTPEEAFYVYKKEKESYIKEIANKWKDQIDPRVYEALINWTIEITD